MEMGKKSNQHFFKINKYNKGGKGVGSSYVKSHL